MEWQPIETAPKDTDIIIFCPELPTRIGILKDMIGSALILTDYAGSVVGVDTPWDRELLRTNLFTHWMPLPEPPKP